MPSTNRLDKAWRVVRAIVVGVVLAIVLSMLLAGCASVAPVKVEAKGYVPIDCGPEPVIDRLKLLPYDPIVVRDALGESWVGFTPDHWENLIANGKRAEVRFQQDVTVIRHYRDCVEKFNERANGNDDDQ